MAGQKVNRAVGRRQGKRASELIEEAVYLIRSAPASCLAGYYLGALPFVLALLFFCGDMSRSAWAYQHLAGGSLALAALFLWMKFWQAVFAQNLGALMSGNPIPPLTFARCRGIFLSQTFLPATALFLLPLSLVPILPFPWVCAFYQNVTALENPGRLRPLLKRAGHLATLWPRQNFVLLAFLFLFAFVVFLNWCTVCFSLPGLAKMLFGVESEYSRSALSMLNTTFFAIMFGLTYLSVDPIVKAIYALRCFYGESLESGADLKADLARFNVPADVMAVLLAMLCLVPVPAKAKPGSGPATQATSVEAQPPSSTAAVEQQAPPGSKATPARSPASVAPVELDRSAQEVIQQRKYAWRMPREQIEEPAEEGVLSRFFRKAWEVIRDGLSKLLDWFFNWLRRIFSRSGSGTGGPSLDWAGTIKILLVTLAIAVLVGLVLLLYRAWDRRRRPVTPIASEAIPIVPDLTDENVGPDQLPEDGWSKLGRELLERGEFRLAMRAFYLGSLAHLAARNLVSLAKFKSNREYEIELGRRGHSFPEMLALFGENVSAFDRIWYGMHEITRDHLLLFAENVDRIKAGGGS
jgi:hypothetical protein